MVVHCLKFFLRFGGRCSCWGCKIERQRFFGWMDDPGGLSCVSNPFWAKWDEPRPAPFVAQYHKLFKYHGSPSEDCLSLKQKLMEVQVRKSTYCSLMLSNSVMRLICENIMKSSKSQLKWKPMGLGLYLIIV